MLIIHCFNSSHIFPKWHPSPKLSSFIKTILPYLSFQDLIYSNLNCIWHLNGINRKLETLTSTVEVSSIILDFQKYCDFEEAPSTSFSHPFLFNATFWRWRPTGHLNINCIVKWWEKWSLKWSDFWFSADAYSSCSRKLLPFRSGILLKPAKINANTRCEVTDNCKIQFSWKTYQT